MNKRISLSEVAHEIVGAHLREGDFAVDATLGNGHDTLHLARCVGAAGRVYGFDIQAKALQATRERLHAHGILERAILCHASHADMANHVERPVQAIMFNLGYLPGADKQIVTQTESTLAALGSACGLLASQGVMTVVVYPGHVGGEEEANSVEQWLQQLNPEQYQTEVFFSQYHKTSAPRLFVIRKSA